jgi:hypothetical protein
VVAGGVEVTAEEEVPLPLPVAWLVEDVVAPLSSSEEDVAASSSEVEAPEPAAEVVVSSPDADELVPGLDDVEAEDAWPSAGSLPSWTRTARTPNTATTLASAPAANLRPLGTRRLRTARSSGMGCRIRPAPQSFVNLAWEDAERVRTPCRGGQET